ncbi:hypothetical protein WJX72_008941 [[Myrmecia] bisecta]|uniref:Diacylglycerol kinase n=1 Tax=[Myrmecia] bisecta TaxID=41462 RepID=A0AAW1Q4W9_9CHLO
MASPANAINNVPPASDAPSEPRATAAPVATPNPPEEQADVQTSTGLEDPGPSVLPHAQTKKLYRYDSRRPAELEAPPVDLEEYTNYRNMTDLREPYRIPGAYLTGTKKYIVPEHPEAPLIVFINSRSGGRAGPALTEVLYHALGHAQVFDLQEYRPGPVLTQIWANFHKEQRERGDKAADIVRSRFRILAAGGDGTVAWILGVIRELQLDPPPAVAVMPLGTGNDLSLSFGWGNTFLKSWITKHLSIYETLKRVADAEPRDLDTWCINMKCGLKDVFTELPHSLKVKEAGNSVSEVEGLFWNYFSIGLDAQSAYGFHHLRETRPWAAPSRLANQAWYAYYSCTTGWFCCAPPIRNKVVLKARSSGGEWREVPIPSKVKAVVLLNLQSYGGGRDLWGLKDTSKDKRDGWQTPIFNDGKIEAVGMLNGWQTALVMGSVSPKIHGLRLAQADELKLELRASGLPRGETGLTHMQLDGEPWPQEIPAGDAAPLEIHVKCVGTSKMLFNTAKLKGIAKNIRKLAEREAKVSMQTQSNGASNHVQPEVQMTQPGSPPAIHTEAASPVVEKAVKAAVETPSAVGQATALKPAATQV